MMRLHLLALGLLLAAGCSSLGTMHQVGKLPLMGGKAPTRILMLLSQAAQQDGNQPKVQGMMCRIYFFEGANPKPIHVDGELVVNVYDTKFPNEAKSDAAVATTAVKPTAMFPVHKSKLPHHLRSDIVGDSYVFWFPYEPREATRLMVEAHFKPTAGHELVSNKVAIDIGPLSEMGPREPTQIQTPLQTPKTSP